MLALEISVVIPVFNEAAIVADSVAFLLERLPPICPSFEIVLAENGSTDRTLEVARDIESRHPEVRHLHTAEPNYGKALRAGIQAARGRIVVCDEIDLLDLDFYERALPLLQRGQADLVIGSKLAPGAVDDRPWLRHLASLVLNAMLRTALDFKGTDTHGMKAFVREALLPVVDRCVVDENLFASELVIRAEGAGLRVIEVPVHVHEKRTPSINLIRRVPRALWDVGRLVRALRLGKP